MKNNKYKHPEEEIIINSNEAKEYNNTNGPTILIDDEDYYHIDCDENADHIQ